MGMIQPLFRVGFVRRLTLKMLLHQNDGACGPDRIRRAAAGDIYIDRTG
jgi:hypothetical protein